MESGTDSTAWVKLFRAFVAFSFFPKRDYRECGIMVDDQDLVWTLIGCIFTFPRILSFIYDYDL